MKDLIKIYDCSNTLVGAILHENSQGTTISLMQDIYYSCYGYDHPCRPAAELLQSILVKIQKDYKGMLSEDYSTRSDALYDEVAKASLRRSFNTDMVLLLGEGIFDAIAYYNPSESSINFWSGKFIFAQWQVQMDATEWDECGYIPHSHELPRVDRSEKALTGPLQDRGMDWLRAHIQGFPKVFITSDDVVMSRSADISGT